jgi:MoaA/NifB/PqqE/SkfB family radical SAM enzyme
VRIDEGNFAHGVSTLRSPSTSEPTTAEMNSLPVLRRVMKNAPHLIRREPCFLLTEILLTYHCNQRCRQCSYPQKAEGMPAMNFENFKKIIDRLDDYGTHGVILSGGEPLLHPRLSDCLDYVKTKNFTYVHILSNLYYPHQRIEDFTQLILKHRINLTCSFDGFDEVADDIRGARDVSRTVMQNMEYLDKENIRNGRRITTGVNVVISQLNLHQIPSILAYLEKLGWPANVDVFSSSQRADGDALKIKDFDTLRNVLEYVKTSPTVITPKWILDGFIDYLHGTAAKYCPYLTSPSLGSRFFIHPNGDVLVCAGSVVGNLTVQTPQEILSSRAWRMKREEFESCAGCWNACHTLFSRLSLYGVNEINRLVRVAWH